MARFSILPAMLTLIGVCVGLAADEQHGSSGAVQQSHGIFAKIPAKARTRANPLASDRDAIAAGKKLFGMRCAECHGERAEGGKKAPSLRIRQVQDATAGEMFWILSNGIIRQGMPDWSKLPEAQRWQIVTYIKSLANQKTGQTAEKVSRDQTSGKR